MRYARARVFLDRRSRACVGAIASWGRSREVSSADGDRAREGTRWGVGEPNAARVIHPDSREEGTTDARGLVRDEGWW